MPRASSTTSVPSRARDRRPHPRAAHAERPDPPGQPANAREGVRRLGHRAQERWRRSPAGSRVLERGLAGRDRRLHPPRVPRAGLREDLLAACLDCRRRDGACDSRPRPGRQADRAVLLALVADLRRRYGTKAGHAGTSIPWRRVSCSSCSAGNPPRPLSRRTGQALPDRDPPRAPNVDRRRRRERWIEETPVADEPAILALEGEVERPVPAASAVKIGGERAYRLHGRRCRRDAGPHLDSPRSGASVRPAARRTRPPRLERNVRPRDCRRARRPLPLDPSHGRRPLPGRRCRSERVLPPLAALVHLPERRLDDDGSRSCVRGDGCRDREGPVALWAGDGELVAVGQAAGGDTPGDRSDDRRPPPATSSSLHSAPSRSALSTASTGAIAPSSTPTTGLRSTVLTFEPHPRLGCSATRYSSSRRSTGAWS